MTDQIKTILIIIVSVSIFGLIIFVFVKNYIKNKINYYLEEKNKKKIIEAIDTKADIVLSDMAADTTGNKNLDCIRTNLLCAEVIEFARFVSKDTGVVVSKLFNGTDFIKVKNLAKKNFKKVNFFKPKSSKDASKETYIHCEGIKTL